MHCYVVKHTYWAQFVCLYSRLCVFLSTVCVTICSALLTCNKAGSLKRSLKGPWVMEAYAQLRFWNDIPLFLNYVSLHLHFKRLNISIVLYILTYLAILLSLTYLLNCFQWQRSNQNSLKSDCRLLLSAYP